MAAAARPNPADARTPCPLCGGLIHPIAGRCKHCKADLRALRSTRPAAAASLPSLLANGTTTPTYTHANQKGHVAQPAGQLRNGAAYSPGSPYPTGPAPHAPPAGVPLAMPVSDGSQPILPPRPTGRMYVEQPRTAWWKSWPLFVIVLAGLAIVAAVVLMVWPPGAKDEDLGTKNGKALPAPERMNTDPLVPNQPTPRSGDPWTDPKANVDPGKPDIDIPDDPAPVDPDPDDPTAGTPPTLQGSGAIMMGMMRHACDRAATCGQLDSVVKDYCDMTAKLATKPPANCPAAQRCFGHIDQMSCTTSFDDINALTSVMYKFQDCVEAMSC